MGHGPIERYSEFLDIFTALETGPLLERAATMIHSEADRGRLGRYILKALCDSYQGDYNPHYLTGIGSALYLIEHYVEHSNIGVTALFQYLDFFFTGIAAGN
jgi:hypothetical protein